MVNVFREIIEEQSIIPGLPDDLSLRCLSKLSHGYHGTLECVSKKWRDLLRSEDYSCYKARNGWSGRWLFVLTEGYKNQWVAYDPEADRWHPMPTNTAVQDGWEHSGFACVCVYNCLLLIGGCYASSSSAHEKTVVTRDVMRFDPFKKEWRRVASMRTPRAFFACAAVSGKVYVAEGHSVLLSHPLGILSAEVYDPLADRWEELPAMARPQRRSSGLGLSYKGSFHVLSDQLRTTEQMSTQVYNPVEMSWSTVVDTWPVFISKKFAVQGMKKDRLYTIVDLGVGGRLIKTRDTDGGEWYNVGLVPGVVLPGHPGESPLIGYGFAALRDELYVVGGQVLKLEGLGEGRVDVVRLSVVRVCNLLDRPLIWRETRPMCIQACGPIIGCVSLEESSPH